MYVTSELLSSFSFTLPSSLHSLFYVSICDGQERKYGGKKRRFSKKLVGRQWIEGCNRDIRYPFETS